jgi:3'-phosphoadenosine 5'-phosphosulfate sulfotransferase (PAPS reductase)/FAD synthetase
MLSKADRKAAKHAKYRAADEAAPAVDYSWYDFVVVGTSFGKDSVVQTEVVHAELVELGIEGRMVLCHADLGEAEWAGTLEGARDHAASLGVRFEVVSRIGRTSKGDCRNPYGVKLYERGETYGGLLEQVVRRWRQLVRLNELDPVQWPSTVPWMSSAARWCTSDFKSNPCGALHTALAAEWREANPELAAQRPWKAQLRKRTHNGSKHVDTYLPIKWWTEDEVWARIVGDCLPYHPAYDLGMPRLSCVFCPFAGRDALLIAGENNPELLDAYVAVEDMVGASFKPDLSLREIRDALARGERAEQAADWAA